MNPRRVSAILAENHLQGPHLAVLTPNIDEYSVLLYQPKGDVLISKQRIGNRDQQFAISQYRKLLEHSVQENIHLVVTPEYAVPWQALTQSILEGNVPPVGCLWALGCESITVGELEALQTQLGEKAVVVFENFDKKAAALKSFLDPLAYVFRSKAENGADSLVLLIQFKTHPSVDDDHFEADNLFLGSDIYVFGTVGHTVGLFSFICSDVLADTVSNLVALYDEMLVLHLQLNPKPRESAYRTYRKSLFDFAQDRTELICLNWAAHIQGWKSEAGPPGDWKNIAGSAWYLRPDKFDGRDTAITANHRAGLYYTWHKASKCHVLFVNYEPAGYRFKSTKVWHHLVHRVQSKRTGPRLEQVLRWDATAGGWKTHATSEDGFGALISSWPQAVAPLTEIHAKCPIATERLLALLHGSVLSTPLWYRIGELSSCTIDERELISRITFAQDPEPGCVEYRERQVQHFVSARQIIDAWTDWPPELADLSAGYNFRWEEPNPHSSVISKVGRPATLVYGGENPSQARLRALGDALRAALIRGGHAADRIAIFHRDNGQARLWRHPDAPRYDQAGTSPTNFTDGT